MDSFVLVAPISAAKSSEPKTIASGTKKESSDNSRAFLQQIFNHFGKKAKGF